MRRERKVNIIRALKDEIDFYKKQCVYVKYLDRSELRHLRLSSAYSADEILNIPKSILMRRMVKPFEDVIMELPIETEYDENVGVYRASLDIWVKPMGRK
jgi:hypothetical protein